MDNDSRVRVNGRIASTRFIDMDIPLILADELRPIDQPCQPYVCPSLYSTCVFGRKGREGGPRKNRIKADKCIPKAGIARP
jgi:hypothetical protein